MTVSAEDGGVLMDVLVSPRASRGKFGPVHGDRIKVFVTAPPVDGAANAAVVEVVANTFKIAKSNVNIVRGHTGRRKTVRVSGISAADVDAVLGQ